MALRRPLLGTPLMDATTLAAPGKHTLSLTKTGADPQPTPDPSGEEQAP